MDRKRIFYGRRRGRPLRRNRQALVDRLLPRLSIDPDRMPDDPRTLFEAPVDEVWLEIGFGGGEHLVQQAVLHERVGFIGCEPYLNGVAGLFSELEKPGAPADRVRVFADDARLLLDALPDASIGRVFLLFPDPWPKSRHHRRRFVAPAQLDALARVMRRGAELRIATDHVGYLRWILFQLLRHEGFRWCARGPGDWRRRPEDWPATRYEEKARSQGVASTYLRFERVAE